MSHKKFGPDRFSRFDVYWIQTNKQTDKPNLYIDGEKLQLLVLNVSKCYESILKFLTLLKFCKTLLKSNFSN